MFDHFLIYSSQNESEQFVYSFYSDIDATNSKYLEFSLLKEYLVNSRAVLGPKRHRNLSGTLRHTSNIHYLDEI